MNNRCKLADNLARISLRGGEDVYRRLAEQIRAGNIKIGDETIYKKY